MSYSVYLFCGHEYLYIVKVGKFFQKIVIKIAQKKKVDKEIKTYEAETFAALGTFNYSYQQTPIHNRPTNNGKYKHQHSNKYISEKERSDKDFPLDSF